jgi:hypothetical protein
VQIIRVLLLLAVSGLTAFGSEILFNSFGTVESGFYFVRPGTGFSTVAVAFTPTQDYILRDLSLILRSLTTTVDFGIYLKADDNGIPSATTFESWLVERVPQSNLPALSLPVTNLTSNPGTLVRANQRYWIQVAGFNGQGGWEGTTNETGLLSSSSFSNTGPWSSRNSRLPALRITGDPYNEPQPEAVPEPSTIALAGFGLLLLLLRRTPPSASK